MEALWKEQGFLSCCGSKRFAREMAAASPFSDLDHALQSAREIWFNKIDVNGWLEAFTAHPAIGAASPSISQWTKEEQSTALATATDSTMEELVLWNARYREKFGFVFLICASGRAAPEILAELKKRYLNRPIIEFELAAKEEMKIIELRLAKLFETQAGMTPSVTAQLPVSQSNKPGEIKLYVANQQRERHVLIPKIKAHWKPEFHKLFVTLCLDQVVAGNKPGTHLNKKGWKYIMDEFYERTGIRYDKKQFKNHWDSMKDQWKIWSKLRRNIPEGGWDPNTQTINMSDEWWSNYLQMHPEAAQFRYKGLPLADLLDTLFSGGVVGGAITLEHSQGIMSNVDAEGPSQPTSSPDNNYVLHEAIPENQVRSQESPTLSQGEFENEPLLQRRRMNQDPPISLCQRKRDLGSLKFDRQRYHPYEVMESRSTATSALREEYSIRECIHLLNEMSDIQQGSELYMFALDVFLKEEYRELFIALGLPKMRRAWLSRQQNLASD
ncbi:L10-interacting MYB domain-containing protein-like [Phoenix dactylifera]|uniref:L10-interacting MYB domain-containing protein-like n=1 Tax=Phoenix dactylifera TaxID=42345 RepID=A0A8B7BVP7_PHODC|nr:L10-interacting MYB domain-containing protein-like [Phoenix dactylifera]XP_008786304.1 L10-interacting MYB domain-containing protein-like [Phoenix dactylifera]XP_008786305.1 L10-interacting MYB domain-containing protein-like [Phoenix dactylifera]XP_008786306.1 L10-interacting MYB domain-containing protein-like [Phoenix dactylifera]XP_017697664.1 L10-interacting MYB domain-containing protein-like [Phoenix dactylifera]XP_017697665.1 L10-interacting MYB domain-containing protein-like [Phoenix 